MTAEKGQPANRQPLIPGEFPQANFEYVVADIYRYVAAKLAGQALKVTIDFVPGSEFADSNEHILTMFDAFPQAEQAAKQVAISVVADHLAQQLLKRDLTAQNSRGLQEVLEVMAANERPREVPQD